MQNEPKLISVIIPALHRPDLTRQCIYSLSQQTIPASCYEIVVVENNAKSDSTITQPLPDKTRIIELSENYGTTGSINLACAQTVSKYVLLLNNDVELKPDFLCTLVAVLEQKEQYAFATGKLLNARHHDRLDGAGDALLAGGGMYRLGHDDLDVGQYDVSRQVIAGCGAATLVRRSAFDEVAGLDEDFFAYVDDIDLCVRLHLRGHHGVYVPSAVGFHIGSATLGGDTLHPKVAEWLTRNQILLVVKDYPASVFLKLAPRILVFQLLWLIFTLARGRAVPYVRGVWRAIRLLPRMLRKRRQIMRQRRVTAEEFLNLLLSSEEQLFDWHRSQSPGAKSRLLTIYFGFFRR